MEDRIGSLGEALLVWLWGDEEELAVMLETVAESDVAGVEAVALAEDLIVGDDANNITVRIRMRGRMTGSAGDWSI